MAFDPAEEMAAATGSTRPARRAGGRDALGVSAPALPGATLGHPPSQVYTTTSNKPCSPCTPASAGGPCARWPPLGRRPLTGHRHRRAPALRGQPWAGEHPQSRMGPGLSSLNGAIWVHTRSGGAGELLNSGRPVMALL